MPETTAQRTVRRATVVLLGAFMLVGALGVAMAKAEPAEDDPAFSCVLDGNHVCGPGNAMGAVPGLYRDGALAQPWPTVTVCYVPPTLATLMLGVGCHPEYVSPAIVQLTGALR